MANTDYKSPDALMRHLRDNGISISGSSQKQQLINTGYLPLTDFHSLHIMRLTQPFNMIQN